MPPLRVRQLLRVGELRGEVHGQGASLVGAQLLRQRELNVFEQRAVGALVLVRRRPVGGGVVLRPRGHVAVFRSADQWFKRANTKAPEKGGAKKSRTMMDKEWLPEVREKWEQMANLALEQAGRDERIDGRSLVEQRTEAHRAGDTKREAELDREPNVHLGPKLHETLKRVRAGEEPGPALKPYEDVRAANDAGRQEAETQQRISWLERELDHIGEKIRALGEYIEDRARETAERVRELMRPRPPQPSRDEGIER